MPTTSPALADKPDAGKSASEIFEAHVVAAKKVRSRETLGVVCNSLTCPPCVLTRAPALYRSTA